MLVLTITCEVNDEYRPEKTQQIDPNDYKHERAIRTGCATFRRHLEPPILFK
jgi:hypothetical protein